MKTREWPLVVFTVLVELGVGVLAFCLVYGLVTNGADIESYRILVLMGSGLTIVGLVTSMAHLGRPWGVYKAVYGLRNGAPLSIEMVATVLFLALTIICAVGLFGRDEGVLLTLALITIGVGLAAVLASARVNMLETRPGWFSLLTPASFLLTAVVAGPLMVGAYLTMAGKDLGGTASSRFFTIASIVLTCGVVLEGLVAFAQLRSLESGGAAARLVAGRIKGSGLFWGRVIGIAVSVVLGIVLLTLAASHVSNLGVVVWLALIVVLVGEFLSRTIFFSLYTQIDIGQVDVSGYAITPRNLSIGQ